MIKEPILDIAHLAHLEILTPKFEESRNFFVNVLGMTQSAEKGDSVYLRGWDDYELYSLKLTASKTSEPSGHWPASQSGTVPAVRSTSLKVAPFLSCV